MKPNKMKKQEQERRSTKAHVRHEEQTTAHTEKVRIANARTHHEEDKVPRGTFKGKRWFPN